MALTKDFGFGPDEQLVRDQARKFLRDNFGIERLRKLVAADHHAAYESPVQPAPYDKDLWRQMVELGWTGLAVPEAAGGVGMKMIAVATLAEEIGRVAMPPLLSTLVATMVLRAAGRARGSSAWRATQRRSQRRTPTARGAGDTDVTATAAGDGVTLADGRLSIQDARKAGFFVVSAKGPGGIGLYAVPADAPGRRSLLTASST
jgi:acyl-CoA dehydrogenase